MRTAADGAAIMTRIWTWHLDKRSGRHHLQHRAVLDLHRKGANTMATPTADESYGTKHSLRQSAVRHGSREQGHTYTLVLVQQAGRRSVSRSACLTKTAGAALWYCTKWTASAAAAAVHTLAITLHLPECTLHARSRQARRAGRRGAGASLPLVTPITAPAAAGAGPPAGGRA